MKTGDDDDDDFDVAVVVVAVEQRGVHHRNTFRGKQEQVQ